jgi:CRISPR-associated protein Cmr5
MTTASKKQSARQILEQKRAGHALEMVHETGKKYKEGTENRKSFVSYVESLPASIINNGLGQAAATLLAQANGKKDDPHRVLYSILEDWLCRDDQAAPYKRVNTDAPLMEAIVNGDRFSYIKAQVEALSYLEWLKKFTVAFLKEPVKKDGR